MSGLAGSSRAAKPVTKRNKKKEKYRNRTSPKSDMTAGNNSDSNTAYQWKNIKILKAKKHQKSTKNEKKQR